MKSKLILIVILILFVVMCNLTFGLFLQQNPSSSVRNFAYHPEQIHTDPNDLPHRMNQSKALMISNMERSILDYKAERFYSQQNSQNPAGGHKVIIKVRESTSAQLMSSDVKAAVGQQAEPFKKINQHRRVKKIEKVFSDERLKGAMRPLKSFQQKRSSSSTSALNRLYSLEVELADGDTIREFVQFCNHLPEVEYAEIDYPLSAHIVPNDPDFPVQWHLHNTGQDYPASGSYNLPPGLVDADIDAPQAWDITAECSNIVIAVVDTGIDYEHPDMTDNMWVNQAEQNGTAGVDDDNNGYIDDIYGYNFVYQTGDPKDDNGHGTHCAGIIAAKGNNAADLSGVCWTARIMALKFLDQSGSGSILDAIRAIVYAVENGAKVISNSYGGPGQSQAFQEAITYAVQNGVIFVASAGNDGVDVRTYPAAYDQVLSVGATDSMDRRAVFSNYGNWVDIAAPGVDILSLRAGGTSLGTVFNETTTIASGTSMACPVVAGVCGLLAGVNPTLTSPQIESLLYSSLDTISDPIATHNGRVNAFRALASVYGQVQFGQRRYSCSSDIDVWVCDADLAGQGSVSVLVDSDSGDREELILTEGDQVMGFFVGSISADTGSASAGDGILQIAHQQNIRVFYSDQRDVGGQPAELSDTAMADCLGPVVSNLTIAAPGSVVTVVILTDEPATMTLRYGPSCGGAYHDPIRSQELKTEHVFRIRDVAPDSVYFFVAESADALGNSSVHDNGGNCYSFTTSTVLSNLHVPSDFATIQSAVERAWDGDTIWLDDGIYTGSGNYNIRFDGKMLAVKSLNGPAHCILDCDSLGRGFILNEDPNAVIEGITVRRGYAKTNVNHHYSEYLEGGAGLYAFQSNVVINNCIFEENSAGGYGGAISTDGGITRIQNCIFERNSGAAGGACSFDGFFSQGDARVENCTLKQNRTSIFGGGIVAMNSSLVVSQSDFRNNEVVNDSFPTLGGGIAAGMNVNLSLENSTLHKNSSVYGGGVAVFGDPSNKTVITAANCRISQNRAIQAGGGSYLSSCKASHVNNAIQTNSSKYGGGVFQDSQVESMYENCTIAGNISEQAGGIAYSNEPNSMLTNSILWGNIPQMEQAVIEGASNESDKIIISFCDVEGGRDGVFDPCSCVLWGPGNLSEDPLFAFSQDVHLLTGSPCIDRGTEDIVMLQQTDMEGVQRKIDGNQDGMVQIDIGAFEYEPEHSRIAMSVSSLQLSGTAGLSEVPAANIKIRNAGGGELSWEIQSSADWIRVNPSQGVSVDQISDVEIQAQTESLSAGVYREQLIVTSPHAVNTPQRIFLDLYLSGTIRVPGQYSTIQSAIDAADDGDTILVADGIYHGQGNRDIQFKGKAIHLKSENGPQSCILDVQGSQQDPHRAFAFFNTEETNESIIEGFTLTGGYVGMDFFLLFPPFDGGAIWCGSSSPLIRNCIIMNNTVENSGGAMHFMELSSLPDSRSTVDRCMILNNSALASGGAMLLADSVDLSNSVIAHNQSLLEGGGIWAVGVANSTITNCTIVDNHTLQNGGGLVVWNSYQNPNLPLPQYFEISNSIISGNTAAVGNELFSGQTDPYNATLWGLPSSWKTPKIRIRCSNIPDAENTIVLTPDTQLVWENRLVHADPLFVDPEQNNYRLKSASPLIDAGDKALIKKMFLLDLDANSRFLDGDYDGQPQVDPGAYEYMPNALQSPLLEVSDWEFDFIAYQGQVSPSPQTLRIRNSGTGSFQWEIIAACPWLTVNPTQAIISDGEWTEITLQPNIDGLERGRYLCELTVAAPASANHSVMIKVTLQLLEPGRLYVPSEFTTIQQAINAAVGNEQIVVEPGMYREDLRYLGKNIILSSQDPFNWDTVRSTIISGSGENPVVTFMGTEEDAKLTGFTIVGGSTLDSGGGIQGNYTHADIENCIIQNNKAIFSGGGIHAINGRIQNCRIQENQAEFGGGIADCSNVFNSVICSNHAVEGGGMHSVSGSIVHCTTADNHADAGAGLNQCEGLIQNCIIWANQPDSLYRCSQPTFSCAENLSGGDGNLNIDPEFVNPINGDYRLGPVSFCIDAADPNAVVLLPTDIDNLPRSLDGNNDGISIPDMGAHEMPISDLSIIGISQKEFVFTTLDSNVQILRIWNAGLQPVQYTVADTDCSWLSVTPVSGTVSGAPEEVSLIIHAGQIPAGVYECQFVISDPAAINSPQVIHVQLKVLQEEIHLTPEGPTIRYALGYVIEGGRLILADGVYTGPGNWDVDFRGVSATIQSLNGPDHCIIDLNADPDHPRRAFLFQNNEGPGSVLEGLTIANGFSLQPGGAVFCSGTSPKIINCRFQNNHSQGNWGGAVYSQFGSPIIRQSVFQANSAVRGGAIYSLEGGITLIDNTFVSNSARNGGAVCNRSGTAFVETCTFVGNTAEDGGGIYNQSSRIELMNSAFTENNTTLANWNHGGGALFNIDSTGVIQDCSFVGNQGGWEAGAILNSRSSPDIRKCNFRDNQAMGNDGGAIFNILDSAPRIWQCTFDQNYAKSWGGAIRNQRSSPRVENCLFTNNSAIDNGGAIFNYSQSNPLIVNCTFVQNFASGHEGGAMYSYTECRPDVTNSIFWGNEWPQVFDSSAFTTISYSNIQWPGIGNIDVNPRFRNPENGDFRLLRHSGCIDAGKDVELSSDLDGNPRPWDFPYINNGQDKSAFDMGAYEFINQKPIARSGQDLTVYAWIDGYAQVTLDASGSSDADSQDLGYIWKWRDPQGHTVFFNGADGIIDFQDLAALSGHWLEYGQSYIDINSNEITSQGRIDEYDLLALAGAWLTSTDSTQWNWACDIAPSRPVMTLSLPAGQHQLELVVNDTIESSEPNQIHITVIEPIETYLFVKPSVLQSYPQTGAVTAALRIPPDILPKQIDLSDLLVMMPGRIKAKKAYFDIIGSHVYVCGVFNKEAILRYAGNEKKLTIQVVGRLKNGQYLFGQDRIKVSKTAK